MTGFGGAAPAVAVFDNYWGATLAFTRSLGRKGVPLHFYGRGAGRWSRYCTRRFRCPPIENAGEFQPWLRDRVRGGDITRVAPTTDLIAFYVSALREEFAQEVQRTIAPLAEIVNCLIKTRFSAISAAAGHPQLAALAPDSLERALAAASVLGYPLMLKPNSHLGVGFVERGALILNETDLRRRFRRYNATPGQERVAAAYPELMWPLLQRYIPSARNRVYSVSGIKDADGGILTAALSFKREQWPPDVGVSTVQIGYEDARILDAGLQIVNQVLSRGIFEVEMLADGDVLYAIDLNPRAFGFLELDIARGCDLPWLWYRSTIEPPAPQPMPSPRASIDARHRLMHIMKVLAQPFSGPGPDLSGERRDSRRFRQSVSMLGSWSDPLPMLICNWYLLRHPRSFLRAQIASLRALRRPLA
jgi:predicted ATP-grasp superfamily ATP-dependent carboligase